MSDHAPRIDNSNSRIVKSHLESQNSQQSKRHEAHTPPLPLTSSPLDFNRHTLRYRCAAVSDRNPTTKMPTPRKSENEIGPKEIYK